MSIWKILTLTCEEASRLVSDGRDRVLNLVERTALKAHLLACAKCKRFRRQVGAVGTAAGTLGTEPMPPESKERVRRAVQGHEPADS